MVNKTLDQVRIPQVNKSKSDLKGIENKKKGSEKSDFEKLISKKSDDNNVENKDGLEFSGHAIKRINDRDIDFDNEEFLKLRQALDKVKNKGGKDTLVVTDKAAYILDAKQGKVVTAVDKNNMNENVFTKIDSTIFIN